MFAFNGLKILWKEEHNFRIHIFATVLAIIAGFIFKISSFEWLAILLAIGLVLTAEIINSSIENLADFVSPKKHNQMKKIKDLSAAAVLVSAILALIVGVIIFLPKIFALISLNFEH